MLPEKLSVSVIDVLNFHQKQGHFYVPERRFSAISLRLETPGKYICKKKPINFEAGSVCIIPEGVTYERTAFEEDIPVIHFNMLNYVMDEIKVFRPLNIEKYKALFTKALEIRQENAVGSNHRICAVLYEIFAELTRDFGLSGSGRDGRIIETAEYMRQNFRNPQLSVGELAEKQSISVALLRREFNRVYGVSPKKYLDSLRIQYAKTLIETGYFTQKEIAERCGFSDVDYFRTAFKHKTGYSIREYCSVILN